MNDNPNIYDVDINNFVAKVAEESRSRPVIVDFWAAWCGPCKMLGPLLERITVSYGGKVALAKVNVDENQELAMQFQVRSIPTVKIVKDGRIVDEFVGAHPEAEIRSLVAAHVGGDTVTDEEKARTLVEKGQFAEAEAVYNRMLVNDPDNTNAHLGIAKIAMRTGDTMRARAILESLDEDAKMAGEASALLAGLTYADLCAAAGGTTICRDNAAANPDDLEARFLLGACQVTEMLYGEAFETFLAILAKDQNFGDGKAKAAMLALFEIVGQGSDLTAKYRNRLASLLF